MEPISATTTPMMAQWAACKAKAKDALLLFRLGDFYEAFHGDAERIASEIGLTLTARQGVSMCGIPFHTVDAYIDKLVAKGHKVAVAEQVEDPQLVKGLVKREIARIVSPGALVNSGLLSDKTNNYFASVAQRGEAYELVALDISTGEFCHVETAKFADLLDELYRLRPAEILAPRSLKTLFAGPINEQADECFAEGAAIALTRYLSEDLNIRLDHVSPIRSDALANYMALDRSTIKNLELSESLLALLDRTETPMGARLLAHWILHPLVSIPAIERRQEAVTDFLGREIEMGKIRDLERLMMRVISRYASPRDLLGLGLSMKQVPVLRQALASFTAPEIVAQRALLSDSISHLIVSSLCEAPPLRIGEGDLFRDGYHPELDTLRALSRNSTSWMGTYQLRLREETGIKTLKVGYTRAFGYYIEVSRGQSDKIPAHFKRLQTLVNAERFITEELKQFEHQILTADERAKALETQLFEELRTKVALFATEVRSAAKAIAHLDALRSLASVAKAYRWARPLVDASDAFEVEGGKHPVIEQAIGKTSFIANDAHLRGLMLITGPNMAGKSTFIRQVALIAILAQIGSYVPATTARIGLIDKIFSRIGASDDLARGQSTFMVEMSETANILHNVTPRSLVLLDEIGRGTSTYDGIAIAWAVAEYLLATTAKTLFTTHYWELTKLPGATNYQVAVQETADGVVFLRKIIPGGASKSYGIHVAKLAGLPQKTIARAEAVLRRLEAGGVEQRPLPAAPLNPVIERLCKLDVDRLTPLEALLQLNELKKQCLSTPKH